MNFARPKLLKCLMMTRLRRTMEFRTPGCFAWPYATFLFHSAAQAFMLAAVAAFERDLMQERQREGIAKAKDAGKYKGRAPTARRKAEEIQRLKADGVKPTEIAERLGIGRASVYRMLGLAS